MAWSERYVRADAAGGGDGTTDSASGANGAWTMAQAVAGEAAGQRINVRAGTYSPGSTILTLAAVGTTTQPIWWRGYSTTPGDLDNDFATAKPLLTFTTGRLVVSGAHHTLSNLSVAGAFTTGAQVFWTGNFGRGHRLRAENTNAGSTSRAFQVNGTSVNLSESWFRATSAATGVVNLTVNTAVRGCAVQGGGHGIEVTGPGSMLRANLIVSPTGDGINVTGTGTTLIEGNTIYGAGSDGIEFTAFPAASPIGVVDNLIANCGGYGINNSTGTATNLIHRARNAYFSNTSGNANGFGDSPEFSPVQESSSPFANAAGLDWSLVLGALSRSAGTPGLFEVMGLTSYLDIGALQAMPSAGGSGGINSLVGGGLVL